MPKPKILIIDDEYAFAVYAKMILEEMGCQVVLLFDGQKTIETVAVEKPDMILIDMNLKDMEGTEAIRKLKSDPTLAKIPILLCSITSSRHEVQEAMDSGAAEFLSKPLKREELREKIRNLGLHA